MPASRTSPGLADIKDVDLPEPHHPTLRVVGAILALDRNVTDDGSEDGQSLRPFLTCRPRLRQVR